MFRRGDQVEVEGRNGNRVVLYVWEDRGKGLTLSTRDGFARASSGDPDAPLVGFPLSDIKRLVEHAEDGQPVTPEQ